ncbi:MAG: DJ-1 family protein [Spirochaetales bacterium]|jgi:protein deglycase|nr:DJ-1 family protein [Spirochaetales bacterium]
MKKTIVVLADGFEEVEAVTPIDFLRRADCDVTIAGLKGGAVIGAHGIEIRTDRPIGECGADFDAVVLPGGMPGAENLAASGEVIDLVKRIFKSGGLVSAICAAPAVVLAPNGFLDGKMATCYPGFETRFGDTEFSSDRVVRDGNVITSRGAGTAAEFAVEIVRYLCGDEAADALHAGTLQK